MSAYEACKQLTALYWRVKRGETKGAAGVWAADGVPTLNAVMVPVELLEAISKLFIDPPETTNQETATHGQ